MKKRGQVTTFIIVAILIVVVVAGGFIVVQNQRQKAAEEFFSSQAIQPTVNNIRAASIDCTGFVSQDAVDTIGIQGGYYQTPENYAEFVEEEFFVPYYYYEGEFLKPDNQVIEGQLSAYIDDNLEECFDEVKFEGFDISYSETSTQSKILPGNVGFDVEGKVTIEREGHTIIFDLADETIEENVPLYEALEIADYITESHREDPELACLDCIADLAIERDLYVDMLDIGDNSTLITISQDPDLDAPYGFAFLNKYPGEETTEEEIGGADEIPTS